MIDKINDYIEKELKKHGAYSDNMTFKFEHVLERNEVSIFVTDSKGMRYAKGVDEDVYKAIDIALKRFKR